MPILSRMQIKEKDYEESELDTTLFADLITILLIVNHTEINYTYGKGLIY